MAIDPIINSPRETRNTDTTNVTTWTYDQTNVETAKSPIPELEQEEVGKGKLLEYPINHDKNSGNWIMFNRFKYVKPDVLESSSPERRGSSIALPVPNQLQTDYSSNWENVDMGISGTQIAGGIANIYGDMKANFDKNNPVGSFADAIKSNIPKMETMLNYGMAWGVDAVTSFDIVRNAGAYVEGGIARNPFQAVLFNSPNFRVFNFDWKLVPKNFEESRRIHDIIKQFKIGMHPDFDPNFGNNLFSYPDMYNISFSHPKYLFKIGWCILNHVGVNYHGENVPAYHSKDGDKIPASLTLSLRFQEIEILTREHFRGGGY